MPVLEILFGETERDILPGADGICRAHRAAPVKAAAGAPKGLP
jgi:hypothetical protein